MRRARRSRESGYALLFIFLTVAIVGIMLYAAMPRVVFEAQRDQEQMLIDRGEQYKRAIQVYFRKFKKYPAKIEDLENSSNQRFLRKRYKDPMTGKDEWRPIHISANGQFIDSLTQKSKKKTDAASVNNFITELKPIGDSGTNGTTAINPGLRRRPSDAGGGGGDVAMGNLPIGNAPIANGGAPAENGDLGLLDAPDTNLLPPGATDPQNNLPNLSNNPPNNAAAAGFIGTDPNNVPTVPNARRFVNGMPNPPPPGGQSSGASMIQNLLTSPRPGGPPPGIFGANQATDTGGLGASDPGTGGLPTPQTSTNVGGFGNARPGGGQPGSTLNGSTVGGQTVGGGIAGFASKSERPGIKIYNEKTKYNEWEFIYDYAKEKTMGGGQVIPTPNGGGLGANPGPGNPTGTAAGQSAPNNPTPTGGIGGQNPTSLGSPASTGP